MGVGSHTPNDDCHMIQVSRPEIAFIAARAHPLSGRGLVTREEFASLALLHRETRSETRAVIDAAMDRHNYRPGRVVVFGNREGALTAASQGLGLAPTSLEEIPPSAAVSVIRAADFRTYGEIYAICLKARSHLPLVREA
ncbi:substrate-binding domain-containing protein [Mycoplana sp. BE70]|uniref:substrate-binding domain-containing protein n=1 Tax=Mycoplana sp. BE70 TaxID=2817775 RepID=UPI00286BC36D|nr:substrate-binding domain-containing protein [Mycoplana sp. BE70]